MPKDSWNKRPPILELFLYLQKTKLMAKKQDIDERLVRTKAILDTQLTALKNQKNGK